MANTDRAELHKTIWKIANDLRGSVDGWDFKQYVLGTLFYRFISENLTNYLNEHQQEAGIKDFDYSKLSDKDAEFGRRETVLEKGFFILPSELLSTCVLMPRTIRTSMKPCLEFSAISKAQPLVLQASSTSRDSLTISM